MCSSDLLSITNFNEFLKTISNDFELWGPKQFKNRGNFVDQDYVAYDKISTFDDIDLEQKSTCSAKEVILPITQSIFQFDEEKERTTKIPLKKKLVFARACDIVGVSKLDTLYYTNGNTDFYYARMRELVHFVILECPHDFGSCFCVSMGGNKTDDYSLGMKVEDGSIYLTLNDDLMESYFDGIEKEDVDYSFHFV